VADAIAEFNSLRIKVATAGNVLAIKRNNSDVKSAEYSASDCRFSATYNRAPNL
jgi:hypothetical protein